MTSVIVGILIVLVTGTLVALVRSAAARQPSRRRGSGLAELADDGRLDLDSGLLPGSGDGDALDFGDDHSSH